MDKLTEAFNEPVLVRAIPIKGIWHQVRYLPCEGREAAGIWQARGVSDIGITS